MRAEATRKKESRTKDYRRKKSEQSRRHAPEERRRSEWK